MPRNPRLALVEQQCKLPDGQLHPPQKRENPQPRRVGEGLQQVCEWKRVHVGR